MSDSNHTADVAQMFIGSIGDLVTGLLDDMVESGIEPNEIAGHIVKQLRLMVHEFAGETWAPMVTSYLGDRTVGSLGMVLAVMMDVHAARKKA